MPNTAYTITVHHPEQDLLTLELTDATGVTLETCDVPIRGHVDNTLLTGVDDLLKRHTIDRSVRITLRAGRGIDENSTLCRMISALNSAVSNRF